MYMYSAVWYSVQSCIFLCIFFQTMWDARGGWRHETPQIPESPSLSKRYASLEEAISGGLDESPPPSMVRMCLCVRTQS